MTTTRSLAEAIDHIHSNCLSAWMRTLLYMTDVELRETMAAKLRRESLPGPAICWIDDELRRRNDQTAHQRMAEVAALDEIRATRRWSAVLRERETPELRAKRFARWELLMWEAITRSLAA